MERIELVQADIIDMTLKIGNSTQFEEEDCDLWPSDRRWYMVAVAGTSLSLISLFTNLLIAWVLLKSRHSHFFFLALLALSDSFLSFMYGPVIAMDIIKERLQIMWLYKMYLWYVGPLLSLCQTSMTFSCYLIILATIERFLITQKADCLKSFRRNRGAWAFFMFVMALVLRGTLFFEIEIQKNGNCTGTAEYVPGLSESLVNTWLYGNIFRFYIRYIATVYIPFFLLAYLNIRIVKTLRKQHRSAEMFRYANSDHKMKIRSASRLLVFIVCSYLIANVLNVLIIVWEYIDFQSSQTEEYYVIYETCTDVISVLYIFTCSTRLFVYISCNKEIRDAVYKSVCVWNGHNTKKTRYSVIGSQKRRGGTPRHGTELDAVAVAIARRLMLTDLNPNRERADSPVHALVISNQYVTGEDDDDEERVEV